MSSYITAGATVTGAATLSEPQSSGRQLRQQVARYQAPILRKSLLQLVTSMGGFVAVCTAMYLSADVSYWIAIALAPLAAGFLIRTFIVQHDCGHGSFFRSHWLNTLFGHLCTFITFTPYASWHRQHAGHHGVWNNLDRRDTGVDMYSTCLTVKEYRALGRRQRWWHQLTRNTVFANLLLPPFVFLVLYRVRFDMPKGWRRERLGVLLTNLMLGGLFVGLAFAVGFGRVAEIQIPIIALASIAGVWLFTVQHRAGKVVWSRADGWTSVKASLESSTYLRMTPVLQWFTGNIGLHHVHHLDPKIPNYRLQECHDAVAELQDVPVLTLRTAFRTMSRVLWDESQERLVTIRSTTVRRRK